MTTNQNRPAVTVRDLRKSYGGKVVLDGVDLSVAEGTVLALLGPNGAGKTTFRAGRYTRRRPRHPRRWRDVPAGTRGSGTKGRSGRPMAELERWNGDTARRWIAHRERLAALRRHLTPRLFEAAAIAPGDRVLDVGCGCGETTVAAARLAGHVRGIDLSAPMLEVAHRLATGAGVSNVELIRADAQRHPLPPAGHDVVLSSFGVMFFDDPLAAFRNLRATLRPDGRLAFLCWQAADRTEVFSIPLRAFSTGTGRTPPVDPDPFADPEWVTDLLTRAGFGDVRPTALRVPAWIGSDPTDARDYARGSSRCRALLDSLDDPRQVEAVLAGMTGEYAARHRPDGVWVEAAAWLVTARAASS